MKNYYVAVVPFSKVMLLLLTVVVVMSAINALSRYVL